MTPVASVNRNVLVVELAAAGVVALGTAVLGGTDSASDVVVAGTSNATSVGAFSCE